MSLSSLETPLSAALLTYGESHVDNALAPVLATNINVSGSPEISPQVTSLPPQEIRTLGRQALSGRV